MTDIRVIAASIRAAGVLGSDIVANTISADIVKFAASLPLPPIMAAAMAIRPHTLTALTGGLQPLAGRIFAPGWPAEPEA